MEQNKTGKYFKYAIGEIILVMIGILLALQVNNWNERRKANINFNKSLEGVFNDLEIDLRNALETINDLNYRSIIADSIINGMYSASDYRGNQSSFNLVFSFPDFYITDMGFNALIQKSESIPDEYEQLINDLNKQFITTKELLGSVRQALFENVITTKLRYVRNFPWLSQNDSVSIEKRIQYYVNNPIYKNEVDSYRSVALGDYYNTIEVFFLQGLDLYLIIKDIINNTNQIPSFFPKNADDYEIDK